MDDCLNGIVNQTYKNIEVIVVDDCSPDKAVDVIKKWQLKDPRIVLVHHEKNKGLPAARNTGVAKVTGDYVRHVDSDDVIPYDSTEKLVRIAVDTGSDIVCGNAARLTSEGIKRESWLARHMEHKSHIVFGDEPKLWPHLGNVYTYLFKRTFLVEHKLNFHEPVMYGEDQVFVSKAMPLASSISFCPSYTYYYRDNGDSMTYGLSLKKISDELTWPLLVRENLSEHPRAFFYTLLRSSKHRFKVLTDAVSVYSREQCLAFICDAKKCYEGITTADLYSEDAEKMYIYFRSNTVHLLNLFINESPEKIYEILSSRIKSKYLIES
ncbi:glycosyltransferase family 2 protein [Microbulbifer pacificus]|uniref:glycosyltransferase family 2 protein n=1 Tax=Microbulbifer pacificus TaxID=407164 RepID=UPI001319DF8B|nr:glycosyltransferase family 2 protein [Microbulbifer pacificus]